MTISTFLSQIVEECSGTEHQHLADEAEKFLVDITCENCKHCLTRNPYNSCMNYEYCQNNRVYYFEPKDE